MANFVFGATHLSRDYIFPREAMFAGLEELDFHRIFDRGFLYA